MNVGEPEPPANAFSHRFSVRAEDIDELGHAGNVSWVRWVGELAAAHSRSVGLGLERYRELGVLWVVRRHELDYLGQAFEGESLVGLTWVESMRGATSLRRTLLRRERDGALLGRAATTWVLIELATGKPRRVPAELMARYGSSG